MLRSDLSRYLLAVAAPAVAIALRFALNPVLGEGTLTYFTLWPSIIFVGMFAGLRPALLAVGLAVLGADLILLPPLFAFGLQRSSDVAGLVTFAVFGTVSVLAADVGFRAYRRAQENAVAAERATAVLRESQRSADLRAAQMRLITDALPALISYVDAEGRYQFNNRAYEEWFGHRREDVRGKHLREVLGPAAVERLKPHMDAVLSGRRVQYEAELPYATGTRHIHADYVPDVREDGTVAGYFAMVTDITAQKRTEAALREADRKKDEFLAVLAHELRNPLAPIRTGIELLRLNADKLAAVERIQPILERQVAHMVRLIDDLLDISRITAGKIHLQRQPTPLHELVSSAVETHRAAIEGAGLELKVHLPDQSCLIDVDPTRFVQVLSNILNNAVKYTDRGGRITVEASLDQRSSRPMASVSIRDTGAGISAELMPRLFDLFVQGEARGRTKSGLGIGLALARQLVEMHGGRLEVQSAGENAGSTFTVHMPALQVAATPDGERIPAVTSLPLRVLIIDDNVDAADTLAALVSALGGTADTANDGKTGVRTAAAVRPDAVLLDIGMPGMDGYDTCKMLRQQPGGADLIIVAVTGWGQPQDRDRALANGFDAHLTKPVDAHALATALGGRRTTAHRPQG